MRIMRILVPSDLSEAAKPALKLAAELGRAFGAELVLLFVVEPLFTSVDVLRAGAVSSGLEKLRETAGAALAREVAILRKRGVRARSSISEGNAATVIVETARKVSADLIVIGTHGRTGCSHLLLGSVAERVVRTAECPVLTVRSAAKQAPRAVAGKHRRRGPTASEIRRPSTITLI
jgi:nucleotide-binding universal stress UspA family protein